MKSLSCYSTVFYEASGTHREAAYESFFSDGSADSYLIPLGMIVPRCDDPFGNLIGVTVVTISDR